MEANDIFNCKWSSDHLSVKIDEGLNALERDEYNLTFDLNLYAGGG